MFEFVYFLIFAANMLTYGWMFREMTPDERTDLIGESPTLSTAIVFVLSALWPVTLVLCLIYLFSTRKKD